jgi:uncharacterized phage infection (PIP) family protein YhgE
MENLFLAVIAFNALLSAAIVGGLAFGMRLVNRKLDDLEAEVEQDVMPKLQELVHVARKVAEATADARRRVSDADAVVTARAAQVQSLVGGTLDRVSDAAESVAGFAGQMDAEDDDDDLDAGEVAP